MPNARVWLGEGTRARSGRECVGEQRGRPGRRAGGNGGDGASVAGPASARIALRPAAAAMAQRNAWQLTSRGFCAEAQNPADRRYAKSHEWCKVEGNTATMGITAHAAGELGDIVFVDLPQVGDAVTAGETCAAVESVKAASDIYAPVSGKVVGINDLLADQPASVNEDAFGNGWMVKIEMDSPSEVDALMDAEAYTKSFKKMLVTLTQATYDPATTQRRGKWRLHRPQPMHCTLDANCTATRAASPSTRVRRYGLMLRARTRHGHFLDGGRAPLCAASDLSSADRTGLLK
ncbi:Glycine cleavage system H protein [Porphyridium purpureum]|uniref:Glycine cleavage system H protein n=1 Tax=Porphyridium purpureum TaxID=35688 RepID=A0A5J4YZM6_PORPP|nr:Glycine cleavage system H protein [Porphyridium purpureum]|eukprot:POR4434..scf208_2